MKKIIKISLILFIGLFIATGCVTDEANVDKKKVAVDKKKVAIGAVIGAVIGAAVDGKKGAVKGAALGASLVIIAEIVIDRRNKEQIQKALETDSFTNYKDIESGDVFGISPIKRYNNEEGLECVDFNFINLSKTIFIDGNSSCKGRSGKFEFITVNDTLRPPAKLS